MATTKRKKRPTKHRGNAAGMVEARGRTGRRPEPSGGGGRRPRENRFDRPPTWRGAAVRAFVAALLFVVMVVLLFDRPVAAAVALGLFVFLVYIPLGYFTDLLFHRRRMAKARR